MAASIQDAGMGNALYNATTYASDTFKAEVEAVSQLSLVSTMMNNKLAVTVALLAIFVVAKIMTGGEKLPKGAKPLPMLPGNNQSPSNTPETPLTLCVGLPYAGRFWDVPEEGIASAWHFGALQYVSPTVTWRD